MTKLSIERHMLVALLVRLLRMRLPQHFRDAERLSIQTSRPNQADVYGEEWLSSSLGTRRDFFQRSISILRPAANPLWNMLGNEAVPKPLLLPYSVALPA